MGAPLIAALALVPFVAWRILCTILAHRGDRSAETRRAALRHFSPLDISRGRIRTKAYSVPGLIGDVLGPGFAWAVVFLGVGQWMESAAVSAFSSLVLQAGCFLLIYAALQATFFAPLGIYSGFVIPRRLGILKQTFRGWLLLNVKNAAFGFGLSWLVFPVCLLLVRSFPGSWWVFVGALLTLCVIMLAFAHPVVLAPALHKFSRLESGPLRDRLLEICRRAGVRARDVFVRHESKISTHANAYFSGIGSSKRIVVLDNLLNTHSPEEVASVVAHEAAHWSQGHVLIGVGLSAISIFVGSFALFCLFRLEGAKGFFGTEIGRLSILPVLSLIAVVGSALLEPCAAALSRTLERAADRAALSVTGDPDAFISTQVRLVRQNNLDVLPHPLLARLYASHPTALQRIRFAQRWRVPSDTEF
jgi:STE24 endopeptidase